jgi:hypothetical protein
MSHGHGKSMKVLLTLVGTDFRITTVERSKTGNGPWYRWQCTCQAGGKWSQHNLNAYAIATVHAVLHHEAEPDQPKWGRY